jgi:hypothetical protein
MRRIPQAVYSLCRFKKWNGYSVAMSDISHSISTGQRKLLFCPQMRVSVTLAEAKTAVNDVSLLRRQDPQLSKIITFADNPDAAEAYHAQVLRSVKPLMVFDYLLVTTAALTNSFQPLVEQKIADGLSVKVETVENILAGYSGVDDAAKLRTFITYAYTNWNTTYVLLGGDISTVPYRQAYANVGGDVDATMPCDLYFACLDGSWNSDGDNNWGEPTDGEGGGDVDLLAEVYVGRAPVDNAAEVAYFIGKTLSYEQNKHANAASARFLAEYLGNYGGTHAQGGDSLDTLMPSFSAYEVDWLDDRPTNGETWSASDCVDALNLSPHLVAHDGHANETYALRMDNSDIDDLSNAEPFLLNSLGCYCGAFDYSDCFAEDLVKRNEYGAFAVLMNSRYGWFNSNNEWMFSGEFMRCFFDELLVQGNTNIGVANQLGKHDMIGSVETSGSSMVYRWCYFEITLFGDPHTPLVGGDDLSVLPATDFTATGPEGGPFTPLSQTYAVTNTGVETLTWSARTTSGLVNLSIMNGTLTPGAGASVTATLPSAATAFPIGVYTDEIVFSNGVSGVSRRRDVMLKVGQIDFFTELFTDSKENDMAYQSFTFCPDGSPHFYRVTREPVTAFLTDPSGGAYLSLGDDGYAECPLANGAAASLYGESYDTIYVGGNGYITFGDGDYSYAESLSQHFSLPRVSALFDDLYPESNTVSWRQLPDRIAVTYADVPDLSTDALNNFQIELFFDGRIRLTYLDIGTTDGLIGLSAGNGIPLGFMESDFSTYGPEDNMMVAPAGDFASSGYAGGPFTPPGTIYAVSNWGTNALAWTLSYSADWISLSSSGGMLGSGGVSEVSLTINANAHALTPGHYTDTLVFSNTVSGYIRTRPVALTVQGDVTFTADAYSITEAGGVQALINVFRGGNTNLAVTVDFATSDGTATAPGDYMPTNGTLSFAAGEMSKRFSVTIKDDAETEGPETVVLTLSNPTGGGTVGEPGTALLTVNDDDMPMTDQLTTTFAGGNGSYGNMFDIVPQCDLSLTALDVNCSLSAGQTTRVTVFYREGSSFGHESVSNDWSLLGIRTVTAAGLNMPTSVDLSGCGVTFIQGHTYGLYVHCDAGLRYTNGSNTYENAALRLITNCGKDSPPFDGYTFVSRIWNGSLYYTFENPDDLIVFSKNGLNASGYQGGPFSPWYKVYMLTNAGSGSVTWTATAGQNWITATPSGGTLPAGAAVNVMVSIDGDANVLPPGSYMDALVFANTVSGYTHNREVALTVLAIPGEIGVTDSIAPESDLNMPFGPVIVGLSRTEQITITNSDLTYDLVLSNIRIGAPVAGGGAYLAEPLDSDVTQVAVNGVKNLLKKAAETLRPPSAKRWTTQHPASTQTVLVYADDPVHPSSETFVDQALQALGLNYTAYYDGDFSGFVSALENDGPWDLVILANENDFVDSTTLDALEAYVAEGGRLIAHSWVVSDGHALWTAMGVDSSSVVDDVNPPDPVYWWQELHPIFEGVPEFTVLDGNMFNTYGQAAEPLEGAEALAGYTEAAETGKAALIMANEGRTIFRGFLDAQNSADQDSDDVPDGAELWKNLVKYVLFGSDFKLANVPELPYSLPPGGTLTFDVTYAPTAVGTNLAAVVIESNDKHEPTVAVSREGQGIPDYLTILPETGLSGSGHPGGPFDPSSQTYMVSNNSAVGISWVAVGKPSWVTVTPASGGLAAGASATVTVAFSPDAALLPEGFFNDDVVFSNLTTTVAQVRPVALEVFTTPVVRVAPAAITVTNLLGQTRQTLLQIGNAAWADAMLDFSLGASEVNRTPLQAATALAAAHDFTQLPEKAECRAGELLVRFNGGSTDCATASDSGGGGRRHRHAELQTCAGVDGSETARGNGTGNRSRTLQSDAGNSVRATDLSAAAAPDAE